MGQIRTYLAIDLKSFYASVECVDRGLDPLTTNLVVADESRTDKTICLAVTPSLKARGISGRPRLFEVAQKVRELNAQISDPAEQITYLIAPPKMAHYEAVSAQIYSIYLKYVAPEDIHSYSIDEVFIDVTAYLKTYQMTARELAMTMIRDVLHETGITATCGIGSNLYLAKIGMDIVAKHMPADEDGVRLAELDELSYRHLLWNHRPLTDFWRIGPGTARRLEKRYIFTMGDLAAASLQDQEWFYKTFGIDAEILIDHAWGIEPCTMEDIKAYRPESNCISEGQVLASPYSREKARIIVREMTDSLILSLTDKKLVTDSVTLDLGYDRISVDDGSYSGEIHIDHYGRFVPKPSHGTVHLDTPTNLESQLMPAVLSVFDRISNPSLFVRRVTITANHVTEDPGYVQMDLFTDIDKQKRERQLQSAVLTIKKRYGKNAILRGTNFEEGATMRERNGQIGGHRAE